MPVVASLCVTRFVVHWKQQANLTPTDPDHQLLKIFDLEPMDSSMLKELRYPDLQRLAKVSTFIM